MSVELIARQRRLGRALAAVEREWREAAGSGPFRDSRAREDDMFFKVLAPCGAGSYCKLIQRSFDDEVREALALACAFVFPYDDIIDEQQISREQLHRVLHDRSYVPRSAEEHRAGYFYRRLIALPAVRENALFHSALARQHEAHLAGLDQQRDPSASFETVRGATYAKASSTLLLGLSLLRPDMSLSEQEAAAELAMWVQLADDAMDRRRDRAAGVRTLMTECEDFSGVYELLERYRIRTFEQYRSLTEYDEQRMEAFLFELYAAGVLVTVLLYREERSHSGRSSAVGDAVRLAYRLLTRYSPDASMRPIALP
ncbi:hypothetical protein [Nannocystis pusilla]|uniref:hypothetical protein n=1 Tax=Nannocystis pusilla TaxID=889268 RepID=UPI003DA33815